MHIHIYVYIYIYICIYIYIYVHMYSIPNGSCHAGRGVWTHKWRLHGLCAYPPRWWRGISMLPVWLDSFMCVTWLIHVFELFHSCDTPSTAVVRYLYVCCMTLACELNDLCTRVIWLIHTREVAHSCVPRSYTWSGSFLCSRRFIRVAYPPQRWRGISMCVVL